MKIFVVLALTGLASASVEASRPLSLVSKPDWESASSSGDSSGSSAFDCPTACFTVMRPVYDANGVRFPNECEMRRAKCKGKQQKPKSMEDIFAEYEKLYGKPFGSDLDIDGSASSSSSGATDNDCPSICFDVYRPVRDAAGKEYSNECYMKRAKCRAQEKKKLGGNSLRGTTKQESS